MVGAAPDFTGAAMPIVAVWAGAADQGGMAGTHTDTMGITADGRTWVIEVADAHIWAVAIAAADTMEVAVDTMEVMAAAIIIELHKRLF